MNAVWLWAILKQLAISGNRGTQQEYSVLTKVSKDSVPFQLARVRIPNLECDIENFSIGISESDKKFQLRLLVFFGIRLRFQPKISDSLWLRLCKPGYVEHRVTYHPFCTKEPKRKNVETRKSILINLDFASNCSTQYPCTRVRLAAYSLCLELSFQKYDTLHRGVEKVFEWRQFC